MGWNCILLTIFFISSSQSYENVKTVDLNRIVDVFFSVASTVVRNKGDDTVPLSDIYEDFNFGPLAGEFEGKNGWIKNLTTIRRTGNASMYLDKTGITLQVPVGLRHLEAGFDTYKARIGPIKLSGKALVLVRDNSISLEVLFRYNEKPGCKAELGRLRVEKLDGTIVKLTGLGGLNSLYSKLATWLFNRSKGKIIDGVEGEAWAALQDTLEKYDVCREFEPSLNALVGIEDFPQIQNV